MCMYRRVRRGTGTENALFLGGRDQKESKPPNYPFLTLCVPKLTLWGVGGGGGGLLHGFVCSVSSYKYDGGVHKINNT